MENKKEKTKYEQLTAVDCSAHIDKKNTGTATLSYLSWAWAWDYFTTIRCVMLSANQ